MKRFETGERVAITHTLSAQIFLRNATRRKFCALEKKTGVVDSGDTRTAYCCTRVAAVNIKEAER